MGWLFIWFVCLGSKQLAKATQSQGPGVSWVGINGGFSKDYTDSLGRVWHHTKDRWAAYKWGGYMGVQPRDWMRLGFVDGNETLGTYQCRTWPPEYENDYEALLHHYSRESGWANQTFRVNLQDPGAGVSYYTVKYNFCETKDRGGKTWDIVINGKTVKKDFTNKWAHHNTAIYHFKCIPTNAGMIEVSIVATSSSKPQARFSTLEFEKSTDGCGECEGTTCGKGFCSAATFYDRAVDGGWGARGTSLMANQLDQEVPESTVQCACDQGVQGDACDVGSCAAVNCNEPFGGFCSNGTCTCISGHSGANCEVAPVRDQFGCYAQHEVVSDRMTVSTVCLPELIAGPARHGNLFRGPSPMSTVSDKKQPDVAYFSWTPDVQFGKPEVAPGSEGRIYVSKLKVPWKGIPVLEKSLAFDGFVRAGGIDVTEDGIIGTLCAKYWQPWVANKNSHLDKAAMVLAVCEVNSTTMEKHRLPWQIGKQYQKTVTAPNTGIWGSYPLSAWGAQRSAGYGYLLYAPAQKMWTAWYGATVDHHTGYAMHTYHRDAPGISDSEYSAYLYPVPRDVIEPRQEADGPWRDHHRTGTGDHQRSAAWFYHPILKDIGLQKHEYGPMKMQQYGLAEEPIGIPPAGEFRHIGHCCGLDVTIGIPEYSYNYGGYDTSTDESKDIARQANALRPCGEDWITGFISDKGNICAKISRLGDILEWKVIEPAIARMPCASNGGNCADGEEGRMVLIAPLGSAESEARCGAEARFLFGYEKPDRSRWLVELDGDCNEVTEKMEVTRYTHWPLYQDWTTTTDGAVMWITSWHPDITGSFGPPGSPNGVWPYNLKPRLSEEEPEQGEYLYGLTPNAINEAKVTIYYPSSGSFASTTAATTTVATNPGSTTRVEGSGSTAQATTTAVATSIINVAPSTTAEPDASSSLTALRPSSTLAGATTSLASSGFQAGDESLDILEGDASAASQLRWTLQILLAVLAILLVPLK